MRRQQNKSIMNRKKLVALSWSQLIMTIITAISCALGYVYMLIGDHGVQYTPQEARYYTFIIFVILNFISFVCLVRSYSNDHEERVSEIYDKDFVE